jgi:hypothetical protein
MTKFEVSVKDVLREMKELKLVSSDDPADTESEPCDDNSRSLFTFSS